jgi:hypothetical protein
VLQGVHRVFFISQAREKVASQSAANYHPQSSFWENSSICSLQPKRLSLFFLHKKSLKTHIDKLKVALCLFGFGVVSFLKACLVVCPIVCTISRFLKKLLHKCSL